MTDPGSAPGSELTDADHIRAAVLACPGVVELSAGPFGEVASYLPGRTVPGVRVDDDHVEVHIVASYGEPLRAVADQIGASVQGLLGGRTLTVAVDDILLPGESLEP